VGDPQAQGQRGQRSGAADQTDEGYALSTTPRGDDQGGQRASGHRRDGKTHAAYGVRRDQNRSRVADQEQQRRQAEQDQPGGQRAAVAQAGLGRGVDMRQYLARGRVDAIAFSTAWAAGVFLAGMATMYTYRRYFIRRVST